jgi:hypothetical protein
MGLVAMMSDAFPEYPSKTNDYVKALFTQHFLQKLQYYLGWAGQHNEKHGSW